MDSQKFLAEFGHIANAPGGIARLRELVLSLAIQGKLITQNINDVPASQLLQPLFEERTMASVVEDNFNILNKPNGWEWVRLGDIAEIERGGSPRPIKDFLTTDPDGLNWIKIGDTEQNSKYITSTREKIKPEGIVKTRMVYPGDFLLTNSMSFGRPYITNIQGCIHDGWLRIHPPSCLDKDYLYHLLSSPIVKVFFTAAAAGAVVQNLNADKVRDLPIPIPPFEEQTRIVAKVDELMALCDQLEEQQQDRRTLQNQLRQATLQAVAASQSPHELKESWYRLQSNFGQLFSAPEHVNDAIAEIKNLAARGLLANAIQAKPDLEKIKADCSAKRDEYIANGLMRRQKLVGMANNETAYPEHWCVCAFDEVAIVIGGVTKGRNLQGKNTVICPYLAVANVQRGYFKLENLKSIEIVATELPKYVVESGDLLITEGGDWDKVGRTAIWREDASNVLHQNHIFKARVPTALIKNEWVELIFNSGIGRDYFAGASKQTTNLASINMTQLRSFPFPIPPQEEQKNILTVFSAIENEFNEWRKKLERKQNLSALFASATIASLTGIAIEQEEEPMKAPQTELMAPVCLGSPPDVKAQAPLATILARHNGEMSAKDLWQRFGGDIDVFYAQLKTEVAHGWILEPKPAEMREKLDS